MFNPPSSFKISTDNIIGGSASRRRKSLSDLPVLSASIEEATISTLTPHVPDTSSSASFSLPTSAFNILSTVTTASNTSSSTSVSITSSLTTPTSSNQLQETSEVNNSNLSMAHQELILPILGDLASLEEQLTDCIEVDLITLKSVDDLDDLKKEIKTLKAEIQRSISKLTFLNKEYDVNTYKELVVKGKSCINDIDQAKQVIINDQSKTNSEDTLSRVLMLKSSVDLAFDRCNDKYTIDLDKVQDGQLLLASDSLSDIRIEFNDLNKLYFEFVEKCPTSFPDRNKVFAEYKTMMTKTEKARCKYESSVVEQMQKRELTRNKVQDSKNDIKLPTFKGYNDKLDYYTFKSQFLNKYRRYTSRDMVDILKNTYLKEEAYNTVKEHHELDVIWKKLKEEFGNPNRMLKTKIVDLLAVRPFQKLLKTSEKSELILKMINMLSDLFKLAEEHHLQLDLYCKNDKVFNQLLKQLPKLWLHDWHALKKLKKIDVAASSISTPAWEEDKFNWTLFKTFLNDQLYNLKEEVLMEESMEDVTDDLCWKMNNSCNVSMSCVESDYYEYEEFTDPEEKSSYSMDFKEVTAPACKLCNGKVHGHYWDCITFMKMKHGERFELFLNPRKNNTDLAKRHIGKLLGECAACLVPNAKLGHQCHEQPNIKQWLCPETHKRPVHILCCKHHTDTNKDLWEKFQYNTHSGFAQDETIPLWKREMKWKSYCTSSSTHTTSTVSPNVKEVMVEEPINDSSIFFLQRIIVDGAPYNVFFDSGCGDFCVKKEAADRLGIRAKMVSNEGYFMKGVGGVISLAKHGLYQVQLPLANENDALFMGLCLDEITEHFCEYNITPLFNKVVAEYLLKGGDKNNVPKVSSSGLCGGDTDLMIGIKYNRYQPKLVHELESGLGIYRSAFIGEDGSNVVIGGADPLITQMEADWAQKNVHYSKKGIRSYFSQQLKTYIDGMDVFPDSKLKLCRPSYLSKPYKNFVECENAGTESSYRCLKCRNCRDCQCGPVMEVISRKEECEQQIINESVRFDASEGRIRCRLPFLQDPQKAIVNNSKNALNVYKKVVAKLNKNPSDKESVIKSHDKLLTKGHVSAVAKLPEDLQNNIHNSLNNYHLPWRPVYNESSLSTPCRMTFDASNKTASGLSLNDILPKGINQISSLIEIVLAWRNGVHAMAGDIEQMYNGILLDEDCWNMQLYFWQDTLEENIPPELHVVKTAIYGVCSSGNQAITGVHKLADHSKSEFPEAHTVLTRRTYVDDVLPNGKQKLDECFILADQLTVVVGRGGLRFKQFAFSSIPPDVSISSNGISVDVAGMKWFTVKDQLSLKIGPLNFAKRYRGKKPSTPECYQIPNKITRRICTSKVGEVWDLLGMFVPITARLKLDLHELVALKLNWDDEVPETLRALWCENFELINKLDGIHFSRATVPSDAVSLDMETIEAGDASTELMCAAVYVRFKRKSGNYSCELVIGKTKLVPTGMTVPRAELLAAEINSSLGNLAQRAFDEKIVKKFKITDSKITLHWIHAWDKPLKIWTRNRVNEILRLSTLETWYLVPGNEMPCDIGTRRTSTIEDVGNQSPWKVGLSWMCEELVDFPLKSIEDVKLEIEEKVAYDKEMMIMKKSFIAKPSDIRKNVAQRLEYSNYIVQPNLYRFRSAVRILGLVYHFLLKLGRNLQRKLFHTGIGKLEKPIFKSFHLSGDSVDKQSDVMSGILLKKVASAYPITHEVQDLPLVILSDTEMQLALQYYYQKASKEVERFASNTKEFKQAICIEGIYYYSGRLLPSQKFTNPELHPMSSTMLDLCSTSFCVPLVDVYSPIAWSLVHEIHWHHQLAQHSGVATTARIVKSYAFIIGIKSIVEVFRRACAKCRLILKHTIDVEFGPMSKYQLNIAPAFYVTQVDLMGPFNAYQINVRASLKIWFAVYVCVVTSTVSIQVMENYSAGSFISSFIRFASNNGYPMVLLPDQGKNIESASQNVELDWADVKGQLHRSYGVEVDTCGVGGHHQHGKVERKIRQIKESFVKSFHNVRISVLQWQTVAEETANSINNLPIGTGNSRNANLEIDDLDIITPNRLKFGRNNERAPLGPAYISNDPFKFMDLNQAIYESWWEHWLTVAVPQLIERPVLWKTTSELTEGDVVLFRKTEGNVGSGVYQYGIVQSLLLSADGVARNVLVKYRNFNENTDRSTKRAVKSLILIHSIDELDIMKEMACASTFIEDLRKKKLTEIQTKGK